MFKKTDNTAVHAPLILPHAKLAAAGFAERQWLVVGGQERLGWGWAGRHKTCPYRSLRGMAEWARGSNVRVGARARREWKGVRSEFEGGGGAGGGRAGRGGQAQGLPLPEFEGDGGVGAGSQREGRSKGEEGVERSEE